MQWRKQNISIVKPFLLWFIFLSPVPHSFMSNLYLSSSLSYQFPLFAFNMTHYLCAFSFLSPGFSRRCRSYYYRTLGDVSAVNKSQQALLWCCLLYSKTEERKRSYYCVRSKRANKRQEHAPCHPTHLLVWATHHSTLRRY
jgi:hypothetical protein